MEVKGINWVGHIYHKYETMLLEAEEDIYQDVLNQVQTVGDSVKKFYSDVMQDLLPPPSPDSLEKYADVCTCKKTNVGPKEELVNVKAERVMEIPKVIDMEIENHSSSIHELSSVHSSSPDSLNGSNSELYPTAYEDANMHEIEDQSKYESFVSVDGPCKSMLEQSINDSDESKINRNLIDQDSRTIQERHFVPPRKGKGRPSKKKIRDALSLKMKPMRMQEYEQLAVWYAGDAGSENLKTVPSMEDARSLATRHVGESDWELL